MYGMKLVLGYFVSRDWEVIDFSVVDHDLNYSDHVPLSATVKLTFWSNANFIIIRRRRRTANLFSISCDGTELILYHFSYCYYYSGTRLGPLLPKLDDALARCFMGDTSDVCNTIDTIYHDVVNTLITCANDFAPERRKCFCNILVG